MNDCVYGVYISLSLYSTVAGKCKTTLQSVKHFYEARDKFTFWKTFLPIIKHNYMGKNTFTKDETNLHFRKQINKTQNTFTSPETNLQWQILHGKGMYHTPEVTRWKVLLLVSAVNSCCGCGCGVNGVNKVYGDRTWTAAEGCFARFVANTWAA